MTDVKSLDKMSPKGLYNQMSPGTNEFGSVPAGYNYFGDKDSGSKTTAFKNRLFKRNQNLSFEQARSSRSRSK